MLKPGTFKRSLLLSVAYSSLALGLSFDYAQAQTPSAAYPSRPVKVIIPFPPGGTLDQVGRMLMQKLSEQLGQQFVVENKAGGNGTIGAAEVAKASGDGYTLLFNASTFISAPMTMKSVPYSPLKDFVPIALVAKAPFSVALNKNLPVSDVKGLVAHAKAQKTRLNFATGSVGSGGHLATEQLLRGLGVDYQIIPYKGTAPAFQDLIGGQIDGFIDPILGSVQFHKSGLVKVVGVTAMNRVPNLPDVPTVAESVPGFEFYSWYGLWSPAKLAPDIVSRLNAEVNKALAGDMKDKLTSQGLLVSPGSVQDFVKFQEADAAKAQKIISEGNIRLE